jgi:hypothetical protein
MTGPSQDPGAAAPVAHLAQLWAAARAAQQAAAEIATRPDVDNDLGWTHAAGHLGEAADELQRARPEIARFAEIPALAAQIRDLPLPEATGVFLASIVAGLHDFDVDDSALQPSDLLAAGTAAYWFGMAHHVLTGQLP